MSLPDFETPWLLALLLLALLPLLRAGAGARYPWLALVPTDRASDVVSWSLRIASSVAIAATLIGLAGPYRPEANVERVGRGAQLVLLLDRSLSMDQAFFPAQGPSPHIFGGQSPGSKQEVARHFLAQFAARRPDDLFAMIVFSTYPIAILPFTQKQPLIQAAIGASAVGHGLSETDIGVALSSAAGLFDHRPYGGSRVVLLVSDGGGELGPVIRDRIRSAFERNRIALYWIYLRSLRSPGLAPRSAASGAAEVTTPEPAAQADAAGAPERSLNAFFATLTTPYRVYEADSPGALGNAIADVSRLENLPIEYAERLPREDLAPAALRVALIATLVLLLSALLTVRGWP